MGGALINIYNFQIPPFQLISQISHGGRICLISGKVIEITSCQCMIKAGSS